MLNKDSEFLGGTFMKRNNLIAISLLLTSSMDLSAITLSGNLTNSTFSATSTTSTSTATSAESRKSRLLSSPKLFNNLLKASFAKFANNKPVSCFATYIPYGYCKLMYYRPDPTSASKNIPVCVQRRTGVAVTGFNASVTDQQVAPALRQAFNASLSSYTNAINLNIANMNPEALAIANFTQDLNAGLCHIRNSTDLISTKLSDFNPQDVGPGKAIQIYVDPSSPVGHKCITTKMRKQQLNSQCVWEDVPMIASNAMCKRWVKAYKTAASLSSLSAQESVATNVPSAPILPLWTAQLQAQFAPQLALADENVLIHVIAAGNQPSIQDMIAPEIAEAVLRINPNDFVNSVSNVVTADLNAYAQMASFVETVRGQLNLGASLSELPANLQTIYNSLSTHASSPVKPLVANLATQAILVPPTENHVANFHNNLIGVNIAAPIKDLWQVPHTISTGTVVAIKPKSCIKFEAVPLTLSMLGNILTTTSTAVPVSQPPVGYSNTLAQATAVEIKAVE